MTNLESQPTEETPEKKSDELQAIKGFLDNFLTKEEKIAQTKAKLEVFEKEVASFKLALDLLEKDEL